MFAGQRQHFKSKTGKAPGILKDLEKIHHLYHYVLAKTQPAKIQKVEK